jgi:hypothetical protein
VNLVNCVKTGAIFGVKFTQFTKFTA